MSKLKELIKEANQIHEMRWKVLAFDPEQDNKLVHTSDTFDCIDCATKCKMDWKEKHPTHTIEIVTESIQKTEDKKGMNALKKLTKENKFIVYCDGHAKYCKTRQEAEAHAKAIKAGQVKDLLGRTIKCTEPVKIEEIHESINEGVLPHNVTKVKQLIDKINKIAYFKIDGEDISVNKGFGTVGEQIDLQNLAKQFKELGFKVRETHFQITVYGLKDFIDQNYSRNESIKEGFKKLTRTENAQKNEADANSERTLIAKKKEIQKLASKMGNDNLVQYISLLKKYVDDAYDYALKHFDESAQYKFKVGDRVLYEGDKATVKALRTSGTGSLEKPYYSVEKDKEKGKMTHPAREFELKAIKESSQKNESLRDLNLELADDTNALAAAADKIRQRFEYRTLQNQSYDEKQAEKIYLELRRVLQKARKDVEALYNKIG